jgi:tetrahydromethanopterin S-methyltransferase subunit C
MAAVALVLIAKVGGGAVGAAICVGVTVATFILGANVPLLAVIPAAVYGYSAVAALALLKPGEDIFSVDIVSNPLINIIVSMVIGSMFAFVSEKIVGILGAQSGAPVEA